MDKTSFGTGMDQASHSPFLTAVAQEAAEIYSVTINKRVFKYFVFD
jgi:hypothetical protein